MTSGAQSGFSVDVGGVLPGNTLQISYTDSGNVQHMVNVVALGQGGTLPQSASTDPNSPTIGIDFSAGIGRS